MRSAADAAAAVSSAGFPIQLFSVQCNLAAAAAAVTRANCGGGSGGGGGGGGGGARKVKRCDREGRYIAREAVGESRGCL